MQLKVLMESKEEPLDAEELGITMETEPDEILRLVTPIILERTGVNIEDGSGGHIYTVRKMAESEAIYILPKSVAGIE